jgi:drug/metabolite transporter (DMT)-like permease
MTSPLSFFVKRIQASGPVMVAAGAVMISFSAVFVKWAHVAPSVAGFYRMAFGSIVLMMIVGIRREKIRNNFSYLAIGSLCGFLFGLDLFFWHKSIHFVGPGLATILANFQVFFLALYGIIMGERIKLTFILALPLALSGLFLLAGIRWDALGPDYKLGLVLGLATALSYAAYLVFLRKTQTGRNAPSPIANLALISCVAAIMLGIVSWFEGGSLVIPDRETLFSLLAYGVLCQVGGWVLISKGMPRVNPSFAGLLLLTQPTLSFIWDILIFHRETSALGGIGAIMTLTAIYLGIISRS